MFAPPVLQVLSGERLHLSHGPIDIVLKAWGSQDAVKAAYAAAWARFPMILPELCAELGELRRPMSETPRPASPVARRMHVACLPFADVFVTPMAAVAGAVADELLAEMTRAAPLDRAFVNDGGDIAIHVTPVARLDIGIAGAFAHSDLPHLNGEVSISECDGIGGIATSGARGRSFSLGIADAVTVLARDAAAADVAATLIANAVDLEPRHPRITRRPARDLDPDSDLGARLVTTAVGPLAPGEIVQALEAGCAVADTLHARGLIRGAALMLQGHTRVAGNASALQGSQNARAAYMPPPRPDPDNRMSTSRQGAPS
jgi:ApbE superfamily uncharacterized protein (UPF0280 family)